MSCVEKRHMSHRVGSMLHHRFPNGFSDLFMDETDREVSTLTDRAFRSLCVGDDAVYNDEFLYGYSPFSCHKPLAGEPLKKTHHKESKKQGQNKNNKNDAQPWKQQQQNNMSHMSSFLKALSATEESCEGMLIKNGGMTDSNGESWDKSALRSIQRELSEFSSDYHTNLTERHYKNHHRHHSGDGSSNKTGKDLALLSGKSSKIKNGKSTVKLRKLNIKNFFLHSEFSPFQTWRDFNRFPFGQQETVPSILPTDNIPKWYDLPFYKELTEAHRKETLHTEEAQPYQKAAVEPPPPIAPKPIPPPPPPKVLPKPSATPAEKRCSSEGGDGNAAPWRRNRSRAKSTVPVNQPGVPTQDNYAKTVDESLLLVKKEAKSVEVKAIEEVSSLASTPFSICQLMTPLIPSRQPTETSEILQAVLSPSALDLPLRPHSEAKVTPEPPVKRDSYKSLASSILFNLKDNRKRVKSRYSPPKFKALELPEDSIPSPQSDHLKHPQAGSEGNASGLSTPAILKDGQTVCSPILEPAGSPTVDPTKQDTERPLSDDYLLSNLLQTKREAAVKDNTLSAKLKKTVQPWSPRGNLGGLERGEEELHQVKENPDLPPANETAASGSTLVPVEIFKPKEISSNQSLPPLLSPSNLQNENTKKPQFGQFLTVPQEEDRLSGVSPSSEGVESLTTSTADTADEMGVNAGVLVDCEVSKVPSEHSGSTCSGNESQTGLPKPPAVLPKSEKAVLKAIKLANRRLKKEEAQKSSHKSSQSSSKHRAERHKGDKSEQKSSSSSRNSKSSEKKHRDKMENGHHQNENHHSKTSNDRSEQLHHERGGHNSENHHDRTEMNNKTRRQSHDSVDSNKQSKEALSSVATERQGRSSDRHIREKSDKRHYSTDRVISNVPVYKAHVSERPMSDRPFQRSQSIDRYLGDKVERRLSADMSVNEKFDPRAQRIEKSIMDELQQRGRARDKASRDNPLRRSHSIDAYSTEVPQPSTLSRQSSHNSHTSQLSRQSSIEHTIVTQSFPMTQRKLLQDPDSGQYFFVDMPVQVKTKTFFDPETRSYVQLPVQPPEGAIPQASPMEVLTPPLVVYHGFVPVPLSPMAQKATIQAPHVEPEEFEQRHLERSRQMHCKEGRPYLEPVYGQHDHMLGEFMGTEELDCPS
ncbi:cardiac-enriched FHL2-interacting protein-like protein [Lates japonicus]|uniref:Cardiac-enriched FHL2-interacting protein-like protein n=1 Tax=Lates japonicus TaxID=270547 RepID=A0AAD3MMR2_LATJO|nr:cardiac-enriched FHL2-interacting protein-like protein [Lates japonicus]